MQSGQTAFLAHDTAQKQPPDLCAVLFLAHISECDRCAKHMLFIVLAAANYGNISCKSIPAIQLVALVVKDLQCARAS